MENIFGTILETLIHFVMVSWGWLGLQVYLIFKNRKNIDADKNGMIDKHEIILYIKKEWPALALSGFFIPVGVFTPEPLWNLCMKLGGWDYEFSHFSFWVIAVVPALILYKQNKNGNGKAP